MDEETKTVTACAESAETGAQAGQQQIWTQIIHSLFASLDFSYLK